MDNDTIPTVTRHANGDGTYRYLIDALPDFVIQASRVLYTHASVYGDPADPVVSFHKTEAAARKTGRRVVEIVES